jgi:hypothetical protein
MGPRWWRRRRKAEKEFEQVNANTFTRTARRDRSETKARMMDGQSDKFECVSKLSSEKLLLSTALVMEMAISLNNDN